MFILRLTFLFALVLISSLTNAQSSVYDVKLFGDSVGEITVLKKNINSNSYSLHFDSRAEASLFFVKTKTRATTDVVFENNILTEGHVYRKKNKEIQELTYSWNGTQYIIKDNEKDIVIDRAISFCTTNFFIKEPIGIKEVFIERFNYFVPIENLGNHQYLTKVDGGTNLYTYKNGILQSVKSTKGVTIYMELRN